MQPGSLALISYPALPAHVVTWMQDIRRRFDPQFALLPPHFTFVFPTSDVDETLLTSHAETVLGATAAIDFTIIRARVFPDPKSNSAYVFLVPDRGYEEMVALNTRLFGGPLAASKTPGVAFTPHITIAHQNDLGLITGLADAINGQDIDIAGRLNSYNLVRRTATGLEECRRIDAGGDRPT